MYPVSGTVTLDGQPIETGSVAFFPQSGPGRVDGGEIKAGRFEFQCMSGEKRVEITGTKVIPPSTPDKMPDYILIVPEKYNTNSTLTATVKASKGGNTFDFALTSD